MTPDPEAIHETISKIDLRECSHEQLLDLREAIDHSLCVILKVSAVRATLAEEGRLADELGAGWKAAAGVALRQQLKELIKTKDIKQGHVDAFLKGLGARLDKPLTAAQIEKIKGRIRRIYRDSKKIASKEAGLKFSFRQRDARAINAINRHQVFWVGNFYDEHLSKRIRAVAEEITLKRGFDSRQAGRELSRVLRREFSIAAGGRTDIVAEVPAQFAGAVERYFRGVASTAAHQARSIGKMFAYDEAGIISYRLENPMDSRTGQVCQQMHGQTFSVQTGVSQAMRILEADSPKEVKEIAPWLTASKLETTLEGTKPGTPDATAALEEAGAVLPPFHFLCRTEPVILATR